MAQASTAPDARAEQLDTYAAQAVKDWKVAGLAIAVVKDGKVVLSRGYGVREHGKPATVDDQTLFAIASTTKAMTAVGIGMLVDEAKLTWNDPVTKHLPSFRMYDPYVTRELSVRDLLTHRAGLGNADYLWVTDNALTDILPRVGRIRPAYSFRSDFIYQNVMYLVAGQVTAAAAGMPWERFIATRLFTPLGMTNTFASLAMVPPGANVAAPHWLYGGDTLAAIRNLESPSLSAAGAVWSNAADMSRWMLFLLDSARANGRQLLKPATLAEVFKPQVVVPPDEFYPTMRLTRPRWTTYGLGWFQHDYQGRMLNFHTGSLDGMVAIVGLIPDERFGVVVLSNTDHAEVRHALMYKAADLFLGNASRDWSKELLALYGARRARNDSLRADSESKRIRGTRPSLAYSKYAGIYSDSLFGRVVVTERNGALRLDAGPALKGVLEHWHYDQFRARYDDRWQGTDMINFRIEDGIAAALDIGRLNFSRVPDASPLPAR